MTTDLSVELAAHIEALGEPLAIHTVRPVRLLGRFLFSGQFLGACVVSALIIANPPRAFAHFHLVILLVVALVTAARFIMRARRLRDLRVFVYPAGLLAVRRHSVESWLWEDVNRLRLLPGKATLKLQTRGDPDNTQTPWLPWPRKRWLVSLEGQSCVLGDDGAGRELVLESVLSDFDDLIRRVQQETF